MGKFAKEVYKNKRMKTQILDRNLNVISEDDVKVNPHVRVTYARAKYFEHTSTLPKSDVVSVSTTFKS